MKKTQLLNIVVASGVILSHIYFFPNKLYLLILLFGFFAFYFIQNNIIESLWSLFLCILPFYRSRNFVAAHIYPEQWGGSYDLIVEYVIRFSDIVLLVLLYFVVRFGLKHFINQLKTRKSEIIFLVFFLVLTILSITRSTFFGLSLYYTFQIFLLIIVFCISSVVHQKKQNIKLTVNLLLVQTVFLSGLILLQFLNRSQIGIGLEQSVRGAPFGSFQYEANNTFRAGGFFFDPNIAGTWLVMLFPFLYINMKKVVKNSNLKIIILFSIFVALIFTGSRMSWIIFIVISCLLLLHAQIRNEIKQLVFKPWVLVTIAVLSFFIAPLILMRLANLEKTFLEKGGAEYRLRQIMTIWRVATQNPLGVGINMAQYEVLGKVSAAEISNDITAPHNIFVEILGGVGFPGLLFFILFLYENLKKKWLNWKQNSNRLSLSVWYALLAYLLLGQFYPWILRSPLSELFWILLGMPILKSNFKRKTT